METLWVTPNQWISSTEKKGLKLHDNGSQMVAAAGRVSWKLFLHFAFEHLLLLPNLLSKQQRVCGTSLRNESAVI